MRTKNEFTDRWREVPNISRSKTNQSRLLYLRFVLSQSCPTLCDPWTVARQAPLSMGFSWQEYKSGVPLPSPGDLPDKELMNLGLLHWQMDSLLQVPPGKPNWCYSEVLNMYSGSDGEGNGNHSSILTWRIPWTEEPCKLQSMGSQRAGHDWVTEHGKKTNTCGVCLSLCRNCSGHRESSRW